MDTRKEGIYSSEKKASFHYFLFFIFSSLFICLFLQSRGNLAMQLGGHVTHLNKSKDEKSVLAKHKKSCLRELTCYCKWSDHRCTVLQVLPCLYRSGVCSRLCPAPSNLYSVSRVRWCKTISVRRLWRAECPATLHLAALA